KGDNWWCVIYPPLCFTSTSSGSNVIYKSRIIEMIKDFIR
ncbi:MAG: stage II sporulation protein R, partial [Clostridia bacterium]|nr:stage II sporulation protein R [Clostridia bacterium]